MTAIVKADPKAPFVTRLRARPGTIDLSRAGTQSITVRVEMPEMWDTVRIAASPAEPVVSIKRAALDALCPTDRPEEYVVKLRGWEVLDESVSLTDAGAINGSIFLVTYRWRRAVR
jgi:hypothetical protein